jgi:hypothetical protein
MWVISQYLPVDLLRPLVKLSIALLGATVILLIAVLAGHTLFVLSGKSLLYQRRSPIEGWSRRFYPACFAMIALLLLLIWLIGRWH